MPDPTRWVTVASCGNAADAEATATVLEAEEIETRVEDHDRVGTSQSAPWMVASSKVVLVREPDEERAREVLGAVSTASEAELEAEAMAAVEEAPDEAAGDRPGAYRVLIVAVVALATLAILVKVLAPRLHP